MNIQQFVALGPAAISPAHVYCPSLVISAYYCMKLCIDTEYINKIEQESISCTGVNLWMIGPGGWSAGVDGLMEVWMRGAPAEDVITANSRTSKAVC